MKKEIKIEDKCAFHHFVVHKDSYRIKCSECTFATDNIDDVVYYLSKERLPLEFIIDEVERIMNAESRVNQEDQRDIKIEKRTWTQIEEFQDGKIKEITIAYE